MILLSRSGWAKAAGATCRDAGSPQSELTQNAHRQLFPLGQGHLAWHRRTYSEPVPAQENP
ncbi:MAG: hypothetical protein MUC60_11050 [Oscillatoria sp. Prado101]|jgi:hypothetical protein|nr:hypothetical protein [Oscillatoria sp. Prado101]